MYTMIIVWLLSNGQIVGESWKDFNNLNSCQEAKDLIKSSNSETLLLISGCFHKENIKLYTAFDFLMKEGTIKSSLEGN